MIGQKIGSWTVLAEAGRDRWLHALVEVMCGCGRVFVRRVKGIMRSPHCRHCSSTTHGMRFSSERSIWRSMISRCHRERAKDYRWYGALGVSVCSEWRGPGGFERFLAHVGLRPSMGHTLDRIDSRGNYEPGNVRWATSQVQSGNKRNTVRLTLGGEEKPLTWWAREFGVHPKTVRHRIKSGLSVEQALSSERAGGGT